MARSSTFDLIDRLAGGNLAARITAWRNEAPPVSFDEIALRLRMDGVVVSGETVRRWCRDVLRIPTGRDAA